MASAAREEGSENGLDSRREKKDRLKKGKEKTESSITLFAGMETKAGVLGRRRDSFVDSFSQKTVDSTEQPMKAPASTISSTINRFKKHVELYRTADVKTRMEVNNEKLHGYTSQLLELGQKRDIISDTQNGAELKDLLTIQIEKAICKVSGLDTNALDKDGFMNQEEGSNAFFSFLNGSSLGGKSDVRPVKLPAIQQYPPYTTWIFLDRNQKMPEDQSVVGRRRIYYDQNGSEALICSDSEEEATDDEDEKHEFSKGEDYILWKTIEDHGLDEAVLKSLGNCMEAEPSEIEARYEALQKDDLMRKDSLNHGICEGQKGGEGNSRTDKIDPDNESGTQKMAGSKSSQTEENNSCDDKDLSAAMDSFDNLFCRRCLVFDCRLHGCSQIVIQPSEKQSPLSNFDGSTAPCGPDCHLLGVPGADGEKVRSMDAAANEVWTYLLEKKGTAWTTPVVDSRTKEEKEKAHGGEDKDVENKDEPQRNEPAKKGRKPKKSPKRRAEEVLVNIRKKQNKVAASDAEPVAGSCERSSKHRDGLRTAWKKGDKAVVMSNKPTKKQDITTKGTMETDTRNGDMEVDSKNERQNEKHSLEESGRDSVNADVKLVNPVENSMWTKLEKGLYEKGLEIFGKNSCLVARNMLKGMKTCREVAEYIAQHEMAAQCRTGDGHNSYLHGSGKAAERDDALDIEVRTRTRFWRRKGRVRRLKYTWKSAGHPAIRKRIVDTKDQPCKQYTPCNCKFNCGKTCACLHSGTCCEKYCGCSKSCKNRFRGCHCAKSQCRSRQCPCFAAGRECDPDVCRNCWVGCGDGTLGGPPQRGDNYDCQNMKLLLRQQQRVLLGRSDVAGWGAFLKNSVSRHDYLGEYTGELISHREADKRGKIYDRENSSFLFNLNDQYVLDAYRKGDKLKFANHSPNPNCYAKVIMVAGDHRVGIFAKDRISAGEELFYDYRYEADRAPVWAKKPEGSSSKREEPCATGGRAQKIA